MSAMANTAPIVTIVTKAATKEKTPKEVDAAPKVNILDFCEEHYEDILLVIMDKIRRDKRKEVHTRLDFRERSKKSRRMREGSQNSSAETLHVRHRNPLERPKMRDRLRSNNGNMFGRLGHRRQSVFEQLSDTYSPSTIKFGPNMSNSRDHSHSRGRPHRRDSSPSRDRPQNRDRSCGIEESYGNTCSLTGQGPNINITLVTGTTPQKKYVKDPVEIYNIKQKDEETIEDFMERLKVETGRMKGAPECMRISGYMHGVNNPELTNRLNEHVPKTMEEMMIAITSFIRGETIAASKKKGHTSWKPQDQPKRHVSEQKSEF
ncbi:hypothetical protein Tco_0597912 [Tanacetum coccineum]